MKGKTKYAHTKDTQYTASHSPLTTPLGRMRAGLVQLESDKGVGVGVGEGETLGEREGEGEGKVDGKGDGDEDRRERERNDRSSERPVIFCSLCRHSV